MDELVHHCIRELAFEGDLGCDVSRLRDFITDFYAHSRAAQNVDDAYCAFVWSVVVQQPEVRVGIAPEDAPEVYVAPQQSKQPAVKKTKKKGEDGTGDEPIAAISLNPIPDATLRALEDLKVEYGNALRIAVDPQRSFVAITGSHIRPSKLTPMVYTALQLISRGRENGISVVDLSKKTGYDPKTCHYLVDKLLDLNLIEKRKKSGVGTNFCIHKYFFERSETWKTVQAEEQQAQAATMKTEEILEGEEEELITPAPHLGTIQFDPIDTRHLSSLPLIRARLEKLLKSSPHNMHTAQNLLIRIGFSNPVKSDRRFFQTRLRELMAQGMIEKVQVPRGKGKFATCIRLISPNEMRAPEEVPEPETSEEVATMKTNVTLHRQIVDLIEQSGIEGITLNELSKSLCNFDRRMIEHQLVRLQQAPPPHLADLCITPLGESHGRERRYKYFTAANYRTVAEREKLSNQVPDGYFAKVGQFMEVDNGLFYKDTKELHSYVDNFPVEGSGSTKPKASRKIKNPVLPDGSVKKGRPRKAYGETNQGKKRKRDEEPDIARAPQATGESTPAAGEPPAKKRRGRARKSQTIGGDLRPSVMDQNASAASPSQAESAPTAASAAVGESAMTVGVSVTSESLSTAGPSVPVSPPVSKVPKRRGRPPKLRQATQEIEHAVVREGEATEPSVPAPTSPKQVPKRRGRPPKIRIEGPETSSPARKKRGRPQRKTTEPAINADAGPSTTFPVHGAVDSVDQREGDAQAAEKPLESDGERVDGLPTPDSIEIAAEVALSQAGTPISGVAVVSPEGPAVSLEEPVSPATARIRRSTRVRKHRGRDGELYTASAPSTPAPRSMRTHTAGRRASSSPLQESAIAMEVESIPQHPHDQLAPLVVESIPDTNEDVPMAGPYEGVDFGTQAKAVSSGDSAQDGLQSADRSVSTHAIMQAQPAEPRDRVSAIPAVRTDAEQSNSEVTQQKRAEPDSPSASVQPLPKRVKVSASTIPYRARVNISQSRREKEFLRLLEEAGGAMTIGTKEIYEAHAALMDTLTRAGEPTSTLPGSRIDKRTLESTFRDLESQDKIKLVSTSVQNQAGISRLVKVAYLVDMPPEALKAFLIDLSRSQIPIAQPVVKTLDEPLEYGGSKSQRVSRPAASVILLNQESNPRDDSQRVIRLLQSDDKTIQASLLTESTTIMQLYGFIIGKMARAKTLHLHSMGLFEGDIVSENVISKEHRIVNLSYYMQDMPVSVHCSVVSCRIYNDELVKLLGSPEGRQTPVGQLRSGIADDLEVSKSRARARMMDLIGILYSLGLVIPLQESQSQSPHLRCAPNGDLPAAFDTTTYDGSATLSVPQYWQFCSSAPIHLWALSDKDPPFWRSVAVQSVTTASEYWKDLLRASTDPDFAKAVLSDVSGAAGAPYPTHTQVSTGLAKLLRRPTQWRLSYNFSWFQKQYLRQQQDLLTPLSGEDGAARIDTIASIVSAPKDEVLRFYENERSKLHRVVDKAKHGLSEERAKRRAEEKATLAQKAATAKAQREQDWEEILHRVHPEPIKGSIATRLRQVKSRYMQAVGTDAAKWEAEILAVIEETQKIPAKRTGGASRLPIHPHLPVRTAPHPVPPPLTSSSHEKLVEDIIALQGPPLLSRPGKQAGKKGKDSAEGTAGDGNGRTRRRHRFQWNKEFDELARDASVIIKARCRDGRRLDWAALEQVFPAVPRNSVRQRINSLREQPGAEAYFKRLEDRWYELWQRHLGTPELPDEDPASPTNFDIIAHVKFLRAHVDKNALRVGFLQQEFPITTALPVTEDALCQMWDVVEKLPTNVTWDFMWNGTAEESREKQFIQQAFLECGNEIPDARGYPSEVIYVADAALKMTLGTPHEVYDSEDGSRLLESVGESSVKAAMSDLLERGVISKVVRDPKKTRPGRLLKISEINQNALGGSIHGDIFQDAAVLEDLLSRQEGMWHEWPLTASDGDTAAVIELVSENKIELKVDTTRSQVARANLDWNSKKTDDDDIETAVSVRLSSVSSRTTSIPTPRENSVTGSTDQGDGLFDVHPTVNVLGQKASCRRANMGPVDCLACISTQSAKFQAKIQNERHLKVHLLLEKILDEAGFSGVTKARLVAEFQPDDHDLLANVVNEMISSDPPLAYWMGYRETVLVSSRHITSWSVVVSEEETGCARVFPRRWLDIAGRMMNEIWEAARRAVVGVILFRPGISQTELRWRLRSVYDRQEIEEILVHLLEHGYLQCRIEGRRLLHPCPADNDEENSTFWTVGEKRHWYSL